MDTPSVRPITPTTTTRRSMVKAAAWGVPAVLAVGPTPAFASSAAPCAPVRTDFRMTLPSGQSANLTSNYEAMTKTFVVPAGVTEVDFKLAGGGGGVNVSQANVDVMDGGPGALVVGKLAVVPGTVLTFVIGNGGIGVPSVGAGTPASTTIKGGGGYGAGGDMRTPGAGVALRYAAGTGGGGSAILVGGQPVVVAGGGGGAGGGVPNGEWVWDSDSAGGRGGLVAGSGTMLGGHWTQQPSTVYQITGGAGASGATPGTHPAAGQASGWTGDGSNGAGITYGSNGTAHAAGQGGRGGDGALAYGVTSNGSQVQYTAGGGGGGYAGGAGGNTYTVVYYSFAASLGGGGGGGSSFVSSRPVGGVSVLSAAHASAGNGTSTPLTRNPGYAEISYEAC